MPVSPRAPQSLSFWGMCQCFCAGLVSGRVWLIGTWLVIAAQCCMGSALANGLSGEELPINERQVTTTHYFDIPRQRAYSSLTALAMQLDCTLMFPFELVKSVTTNRLVGNYRVDQALSILLDNTGLVGRLEPGGVLRISPQQQSAGAAVVPESYEFEEVIVTGIRSSLFESLTIKRDARLILEAITAEQIGKMPDQSVAESLQRLPGVQIERRGGEAAQVRIRGFEEVLTLVNDEMLLTGMEYFQLHEWREEYRGSLEGVPSELLDGLEVRKSVSAASVEGGIGGTVNLKTRNAMDLDAPILAGNVKLDSGQYSREIKPSVFMMVGNNWNDKFAVLATLSTSARMSHVDSAQAFSQAGTRVQSTNQSGFSQYVSTQNPTLAENSGDMSYEGLSRLASDAGTRAYIVPEAVYLTHSDHDIHRNSLSSSIMWQPQEHVEFSLDWFHMGAEISSEQYSIVHRLADNLIDDTDSELAPTFFSGNAISILEEGVFRADGRTVSAGELSDGRADNAIFKALWRPAEQWQLKVAATGAAATLKQQAGYGSSTFLNGSAPTFVGVGNSRPDAAGVPSSSSGWLHLPTAQAQVSEPQQLMYRAGALPSFRFSDESVVSNPDYHSFESQWARRVSTEQEARSLRFDGKYSNSRSVLSAIRFGLRASDHLVDYGVERYLTDFSQNTLAQAPENFDPARPPAPGNAGVRDLVYYDLCGNGGLPEGELCDVDGDGIDDNQPFGPNVFYLSPYLGPKAFELTLSGADINGDPVNMGAALYGGGQRGTTASLTAGPYYNALSQSSRFNRVPGYIPWFNYRQQPERVKTINQFFPSGGYAHQEAVFQDAAPMAGNALKWIDSLAPGAPVKPWPVPAESWRVRDQTTAAYIEADLEGNSFPFYLNFGLRLVNTRLSISSGEALEGLFGSTPAPDTWNAQGVEMGWQWLTRTVSYWDLLPSFNFVLDTGNFSKLRFSGARTMARQNAYLLGGGNSKQYAWQQSSQQSYFRYTGGDAGNPYLQPMYVMQFDLAYEWYFRENAYVSIGGYTKSIDGLVSQQWRPEIQADETDSEQSLGAVLRPNQNSGGFVSGVELAIQTVFDNGFGFAVNYSYADSQQNQRSLSYNNEEQGQALRRLLNANATPSLPQLSGAYFDRSTDAGYHNSLETASELAGVAQHLLNVVGFYESDRVSLRLAYSWRDGYLSQRRQYLYVRNEALPNYAVPALSQYYDPYGQLDASLLWDMGPHVGLGLDLINITEATQSSYLGYSKQFLSYAAAEPRAVVTLRLTF